MRLLLPLSLQQQSLLQQLSLLLQQSLLPEKDPLEVPLR